MRKRKYFHLLQCLCLELNRLLELLPSVFSFSTSACSMCWFLCPHHVVSGEGAIYPQHTELQIEHPSLITDAQVAMLFFRCLAVFSLLSEYVVVCGYCTRDQPDFDMSRVHTCYLSIIHLEGKWLVGHVYRIIFHVGCEKEKPWTFVAFLDTDVKRNFRFEHFCWFVSLRWRLCMWTCLILTCFSPAHPMRPEESPTSKRFWQIVHEHLCPYGTGIDVRGGCPAHACKSRQVC